MNIEAYPRIFKAAAFLVAVVAAIYIVLLISDPVLRPIFDVAPPFIIAIALALLLDPFIDYLQKKGLSRGMGVAVVGLSFLIVFLLVGFLLFPKIVQQASELSKSFPDTMKTAQAQIDSVLNQQKSLLHKLHLPTSASAWTTRFSTQLKDAGSKGVSFIADMLTAALSRVLWLIIIPLSTLWLLRDLDYIRAKIVHLTPAQHREKLINMSCAVGGVFEKYVRGMMIVAMLYSAVAMIVFSAGGLSYGLIIGAVAGLLYMVPYVGVILLVLITGVAGIAQPLGGTHVAILMSAVVVQSFLIFDMIITPRIVGGSVGVHPVLALFSLAVGARMFGVVGMVLAVPVAASVQVALGQLYPQILDKVGKMPAVAREEPKSEPAVEPVQETEST